MATVQGFTAQTNCLNSGLTIQGTTIRVPYDKQVPGLPAQPGAGGGYMTPSLVSQAWNAEGGQLKGLMTWSINWDGSKGWTLGDNVKSLEVADARFVPLAGFLPRAGQRRSVHSWTAVDGYLNLSVR